MNTTYIPNESIVKALITPVNSPSRIVEGKFRSDNQYGETYYIGDDSYPVEIVTILEVGGAAVCAGN